MIYLDNAATTFPKPKEVTDVYTQWGCEMPVNAGRGSYRLAAQAEQQIRETRGKLAKYVHALSDEDVYFTASATMAAINPAKSLPSVPFQDCLQIRKSPLLPPLWQIP